MGIRIDGTSDLINASDGSLTVEGLSINVSGVVTASDGFKVGSAATIFSNGNAAYAGIVTASGTTISSTGIGIGAATNGSASYPSVTISGTSGGAVHFEDDGDLLADIYGSSDGLVLTARKTSDAITFQLNSGSVSEKARFDSSGRLLIGATTSTTVWGYGQGSLQVIGDYQGGSASFINNEANTNSQAITLGKTRNGSIVQDDDTCGSLVFSADDGNGYSPCARIMGNVDGTPGDGDMPGRLAFHTTPDGSASLVERMRITAKGDVGINTTGVTYSDHVYLAIRGNATDRGGVLHLGNSTHSCTGQVAIYQDKFWLHSGTSHPVVFGAGGASQMMTLSTAGKLGIGQASPDQLLHISGNETAIIRLENPNAMGQDDIIGSLEFEKQDASGAGAGICGGMRCRSDDSYGARTYIAFSTRGNSTGQAATDTERFRITAQGGVTFNGDTSYDNALNDYEEGTFTPSVSSGLSGGSIAYNSRSGRYTVIGNVCYFTFHMNISSCSLDSGQLKFGGLPKTAVNNDSNKSGSAWMLISNGNIGSTNTFRVETNSTDLSVINSSGDAYAANSSSLNAGNRQIAFAGFYYLP